MKNFVFLGSSNYALKVLKKIITSSESRPLYLIDNNMDQIKKKNILKEMEPYLMEDEIFDASILKNTHFLEEIAEKKLLLAVCVHLSIILKENFFSLFKYGVVNLHPSFLPHNRGHWPEVWSILNNTPNGITLHYINNGIDTGDIIQQIEIPILPEDTGESVCLKLEEQGLNLIASEWSAIMKGQVKTIPQEMRYPLNNHKDLESVLEINLDQTYRGRDLINLLRALTMPSYLSGAYFVDEASGDRIYMNINFKRVTKEKK